MKTNDREIFHSMVITVWKTFKNYCGLSLQALTIYFPESQTYRIESLIISDIVNNLIYYWAIRYSIWSTVNMNSDPFRVSFTNTCLWWIMNKGWNTETSSGLCRSQLVTYPPWITIQYYHSNVHDICNKILIRLPSRIYRSIWLGWMVQEQAN